MAGSLACYRQTSNLEMMTVDLWPSRIYAAGIGNSQRERDGLAPVQSLLRFFVSERPSPAVVVYHGDRYCRGRANLMGTGCDLTYQFGRGFGQNLKYDAELIDLDKIPAEEEPGTTEKHLPVEMRNCGRTRQRAFALASIRRHYFDRIRRAESLSSTFSSRRELSKSKGVLFREWRNIRRFL
ncbi:hypothetical protein K438DRAFT_1774656 [Mycena galopus ATCC 62051]|nr:hypothetical protein K438DRAFT_1774656 [Mycena galopus ATCC 62051]